MSAPVTLDRPAATAAPGTAAIRARRLGVRLHRWLALIALLPMAVAALTGGLLVFGHQLDRWLQPALHRSSGQAQPIDAVRAVAVAAVPGRAPGMIALPNDERATAIVSFAGEPRRQLVIDPADGRVLADRSPQDTPSGFLLALHRRLFAGVVGEWVVGVSGVIGLIALGTGLWAWWPARWAWQAGSAARLLRGSPTAAFDLHRLLGVASLPLAALIVVTGLAMTFPKTARATLGTTEAPKPPRSAAGAGAGADAPLAPMIVAARAALPDAVPMLVALPKGPDDAVGVRLRVPGEWSHGARSVAWFDRRSGALLRVDPFAQQPTANRVLAMAFPLHTGEIAGLAGMVVWTLAALALLVLSVTGALLWLRRRARRAASTA